MGFISNQSSSITVFCCQLNPHSIPLFSGLPTFNPHIHSKAIVNHLEKSTINGYIRYIYTHMVQHGTTNKMQGGLPFYRYPSQAVDGKGSAPRLLGNLLHGQASRGSSELLDQIWCDRNDGELLRVAIPTWPNYAEVLRFLNHSTLFPWTLGIQRWRVPMAQELGHSHDRPDTGDRGHRDVVKIR